MTKQDHERKRPDQYHPGQIVLWLVSMILLFSQAIVSLLDACPAWLQATKGFALPIAIVCLGLTYNRRLFKPVEPLAPELVASRQRTATRRAYDVAFWVALAYAFGALLGASQAPLRVLVLSGLAFTFVLAMGVHLWLNRLGAARPA